MTFWNALAHLSPQQITFLFVALVVAFGFEFINGFHDTANAVTTVIYTRTLKPTPAVLFSGLFNFLGVLCGGVTVAFSIVHLLPVDLLVNSNPSAALVMVLALLLAGVIWNLGTWYYGLPVSSSHTLIGAILGVGIAHGFIAGHGLRGVDWVKAEEVAAGLLLSPLIGFVAAGGLLLLMKKKLTEPRLYHPPQDGDTPPKWVRWLLIGTCGGVSFAHGSNDGQKGMGLILLVLIGFLPAHYALDTNEPGEAARVRAAAVAIHDRVGDDPHLPAQFRKDLDTVMNRLQGVDNFHDVTEATAERWELRKAILRLSEDAPHTTEAERKILRGAVEFVPLWVIVGVAVALGVGTTIGYKRIVITVAEKIGKTHLTYAQGAAAELVAAVTILLADVAHAPVSTTHVLSSGVAGTMAANGSGVQGSTIRKIAVAWVLTLPCAVILAAGLYTIGRALFT